MFKQNKLSTAIVAVLASVAGSNQAFAQDAPAVEEVVVTGIRAAVQAAMDIKRDSAGVVDAISAEDIGKFPDTNLAESLQRITGVSIDRVNGEGSEVTVRGFGGGNNMVTLNGRYMPSANVSIVGGDQSVDFAQGTSRSFDFSNLASEGVSALEVHKTGRADVASGGIGATINIKTLRPLEKPGFNASIGGKILKDPSVVDGDEYTPELSGLVSWTDEDDKFGVSLFTSYSERQSAGVAATVNGWNIRTYNQAVDPLSGFVSNTTDINGAPLDPAQLVAIPNDSRWHLAEAERTRLNGMLTLQYRPMDSLTLTVDALVVDNALSESRNDQTNWFNRPFGVIGFDANPEVAASVFLQENIAGVKDTGFEQQYRSTVDTMNSVGFNAAFEANEKLSFNLDAHSSEAESAPDGRNGTSSVLVGIGAPVIASHSLDFRRTGFPVQSVVINDSIQDTKGLYGGTNANGVLDKGDLGSQMLRTNASTQTTTVDQVSFDGKFESDFGTFGAGVDYITLEMNQKRIQTEQTLGNWGIDNPGDIPGNLIEEYCLACLFNDFDDYAAGASLKSYKGNAEDLGDYLSGLYLDLDTAAGTTAHAIAVTNNENNTIKEETTAIFASYSYEGELNGMPYAVNVGVRSESTDITSTSILAPVTAIDWVSDNDFRRSTTLANGDSAPVTNNTLTSSYSNTLPNLDFSLGLTDDVKARASLSKTIARPGFGSLFVADTPSVPARPTALGANPGGTSGNPALKPLESTNLDLSVEWYYADSSYVSVGYFEKSIKNFLGTGIVERPMFDLRDPTSGAAGTRSGRALEVLDSIQANRSDVNLFTMTALIENRADEATAIAEYQANLVNGELSQTFVDQILADYDIEANDTDPLYNFAVATQVNNREGHIDGYELALQHFFGESGWGMIANYTLVNGDTEFNNAGIPSVDQFPLLGLSDTANLVGFYENDSFSIRLSWNWRDSFINATGRGSADRNPVYTKEFEQIDLNMSYEINDNIQITFEAINLLGADTKTYGRSEAQMFFMGEQEPRYMVGLRYTL